MKRYILLSLVVLTCFSLNAQDLLIFKTDKVEKTKILEVTSSEILYKLYDNIDGPTYRINKSEISTIIYENGITDVFNQTEKDLKSNKVENNSRNLPKGEIRMYSGFLKPKFTINGEKAKVGEVQALMKQDEYIYSMFRQGKILTNWSTVFDISGFVLFWGGWGVYGASDKNPAALGIVGGGAVLYLAGIITGNNGGKKMKISINKYNEIYAHENTTYKSILKFGLTQNGVGFTLNF